MSFAPPPRKNQIVTILMLTMALIGLIVMESRCGRGVDAMFRALEGPAPLHDGGAPNRSPAQ